MSAVESIKKALQKIPFVNRAVIRYKETEKHVSYGSENADKTFFVIRRNAPNAGLYSFVLTNLGWIRYAVSRGYIPVIDMQSFYNTYLMHEQVGVTNSWEYYFEQPGGYSLCDIARSKNVILSSINAPEEAPLTGIEKDLVSIEMWRDLAARYLSFSQPVKTEIERQCRILFAGKRVLGVLCRGTDYIGTRPAQHPIQPTADMVIEKADQLKEALCCDLIYLATEDDSILRAFKEYFRGELRFYEEKRYEDTGSQNINELSDYMNDQSSDPRAAHYQKGFDYAVTIGILAECNGLVAGRVSGSYGALLQGKHYEETYLFDLGLY